MLTRRATVRQQTNVDWRSHLRDLGQFLEPLIQDGRPICQSGLSQNDLLPSVSKVVFLATVITDFLLALTYWMIAATEALTSTRVHATVVLITTALSRALGLDASMTVSASSESDHHQMNRCVGRLIATDVFLESQSGLVIVLVAHVLPNSSMAGMDLLEEN